MGQSEHDFLLQSAVQQGVNKPGACSAIRTIYSDLQREIDSRKPVCSASGKCCNFEAYGHRLYVTTLELATFTADFSVQPIRRQSLLPVLQGGCPLQQDKLCGVHAIRPFGCRVFFCDPTATEWQQQLYERFHGQIKALHISTNTPYLYVEWRSALKALFPSVT